MNDNSRIIQLFFVKLHKNSPFLPSAGSEPLTLSKRDEWTNVLVRGGCFRDSTRSYEEILEYRQKLSEGFEANDEN